MNTLSTSSALVALTLLVVGMTPSVLAQQAHRPTVVSRSTAVTRSASPSVHPVTKATQKKTVVATQPTVTASTPVAAPPRPRTAPVRIARPLTNGRHKYLNAGLGLATYYGGGLPLGVSFEVDTKNNLSVGGSVDFFRYNPSGYGYTFVYAGARASYHLGELFGVTDHKFDPYVGATLGLRYAGYTSRYGYDNFVSPYNSGLYLGIHLGSRYMFSEKIGGFAEVGYGVSALRLGIAAKF